ncbi:penicillin-binding protein [Couchioplanes caeruleus]|uniref:penicillin-binding transpeptidase domain-containing protein n=1 Tax=Couchioplanes caeruleus TaxID=56438 RepID=UPI00201C5D00|nr:penicillin-binding transpeptidase domain-containing protein [Couchioplanes caeruleus]UQU63164.1 penicillin-binding protein [Couchioplanes caeruleus]
MPPRSDETPRRGQEPRRGASAREQASGADDERGRGFGGIGDARAYTPRGRTVREGDQRTRSPRSGRTSDPFRPALQVLDGGRPPRERRRDAEEEPPQPRRGRDRDAQAEPRGARERRRDDDARESRARKGREQGGRDEPRGRVQAGRGEPTRVTAGAGRTRSTASPRRGAAPRTETAGRPGRERRVAAAPGPRRDPGGRPGAARPGTRRPGPVLPAEPPKLANSTRRLRLGTVLALSLFVAIGVRLVVLQVGDPPADAQNVLEWRQTRVVLPAPRGSILDRSGAVLAHSVEARYIYADPEMVKDPVATAARLSPLLGVPQSKLLQLMAKKKRPGGGASQFEYLARGVDIAVADRIKGLNLPGIGSGRDERRDVPGADLAANLIGFTGEDHTGLEGIEARYDELLRGTDGEKVYEVGQGDLAKEIPGGYHRETPAAPGSSIQLTIDRDLQFEVQRYLTQQMKKVQATVAGAIVLDARTGEVLAQASYPTYNAQKPFDFKPTERVDAVSSVISDPGSTHKAFTIGAALQEGVIGKNSQITVGRALMLGGTPFKDDHPFPNGTKLSIPQVLAYSSNVGTIRIGQKLGKDKLYEYQQKFGLGRATNEGMPGEATGRLLSPDEWSGSAWGSVPIGHSVDATLLQMAAGYAAIANDGVYIQPHLIRSTISGRDGMVTTPAPPETHEVLSPQTARDLREMMEAVVDAKGATGTRAKVEGYRVSGKTGTGKMLVDGQYTSHNAGSFIGMAPAENPRFVVGVFADVPDGTGGVVAAPAFSKMMGSALLHYRVPPSGTPPPTFEWKD